MSFELLIDTPGYAVAMIDGVLRELSYGELTASQLPGIVADAIAFDAA